MQRILYLSLVQIVTKGELILYILFRGIKQTVYFLRIKRYSLGKKRFTKKPYKLINTHWNKIGSLRKEPAGLK